jgi:UDP-GlcNAc:undecaprenyl-phosphate GlcNAc-1-phosphate transferase
MIALVVAGALLGFLAFNFPPAKIFLGDGGAYFVGFFIAAASLQSSNKGAVAAALLVVVIALGIPVLDTLFALVRRAVRGVPLFRADAEHVHHRLLELGFSKGSALLTLYSVCAVLSVAGLSLFWARGLAVPIASALLVVLALVAARLLGYVDSVRDVPSQLRRALKNRADVRYATLLGDVLELEAHRDPTPEQFWSRYDETLRRVGLTRDPGEFAGSVLVASNPDLYRVPDDPNKNWAAIAGAMHPGYHAAEARWKPDKDPQQF